MATPQSIQSLLAGQAIAATGAGGSDKSKVKELATQFEAMLLSQMLKGLQTSMMDGEESEDGAKAGPLGDVMTQELGLALSRAGGFGLGTMLTGAMNRTPGLGGTAPASPADAAKSMVLSLTQGGGDAPGLTPSSDAPDAGALDAAAMAAFNVPTPRVSSAYGWRNDPIDGGTKFHKGMDLPMPVGSEVRVPADGRVVSVGQQSGFGLTVVVAHGNGLETLYGHLSSTDVQPGDPVRAGDQIARSGNTGRSTGPHLHFEVTVNGQSVNPQGWAAAVASRSPAIGQ